MDNGVENKALLRVVLFIIMIFIFAIALHDWNNYKDDNKMSSFYITVNAYDYHVGLDTDEYFEHIYYDEMNMDYKLDNRDITEYVNEHERDKLDDKYMREVIAISNDNWIEEMEERDRIAEERRIEEERIAKEKKNSEKEEVVSKTQTSNENNHNSEKTGHRDSFEMTSYTAWCSTGCIGKTASGYDVSNTIRYDGMRIIATDTSVIPMHSIVKVYPEYGLEPFTAIAKDTGGAIKGEILDLLVDNKDRARYLGRQSVEIEVIRWGK